MRLQVHEAFDFDIYNDIARIHRSQRTGIEAGSICALRVIRQGARCSARLVLVRGSRDADSKEQLAISRPTSDTVDQSEWIRLDEMTRRKLGVEKGCSYEFELIRVPAVLHFLWALTSSNPTTRIATQLAIVTFTLGVVIGHLW
jgi:hypothetical protein